MPHVDEGQLHALLDGAYDEREARSIHDHIAACAECAARLEMEQALRARASTILADAQPIRLGVPPFETVLEKASTVQRARFRMPGPTKLAWAASLVLALGLGWFSSSLTSNYQTEMMPSSQVQPLEEYPPAAPPAPAPPPAPRAEPQGTAVQEAARRNEDATVAQAKGFARATPSVAEVKKESVGRAFTGEGVRRAADVSANSAADQTLAGRAVVSAAGAPPTAGAVAGGRSSAERLTSSALWQTVTLQDAQNIAGRPILLVPGQVVSDVAVSRDGGPVRVRVTQRLNDNSTLELMQEPAPIAMSESMVTAPQQQRQRQQSAAAQRQDARSPGLPIGPRSDGVAGWEMKVVQSGVLVTGRADIPTDSLRAFMSRIRDAGGRR
jgi:hypothetical protein